MKHVYSDGGRETAGYAGTAGDCCARAFAIATGRPYQEVYDRINALAATERRGRRKRGVSSARNGVYKNTAHRLAYDLATEHGLLPGGDIARLWTPTMFIGKGCTVHLVDGELPRGRLVVSVSKHYTAVIDGVIHDTFDPQREVHCIDPDDGRELKRGEWRNENGICRVERRCVYGYWTFET